MKRRACVVVASEMTVRAFLVPLLRAMQSEYDVTIVVNTANTQLLCDLGIRARLRPLAIERRISPARDAQALLRLIRLMRAGGFDLVHSFTPKAGLLAMTAAWVAGVPVRLHTYTGQVWATRRGLARILLKAADRVTAACATRLLADSCSQREFLIRERVVDAGKSEVLAHGSVTGVDLRRFRPNAGARHQLRQRLGIPHGAVVILYVGRLHRDKGVLDLGRAFRALAAERSDVHLLLAGPDEQKILPAMKVICGELLPRLHAIDFTDAPEAAVAAADVVCLPSYREGFGTVIIEAAAAAVPAVASRIYGIVDAVEDGKTGLLHAAGDVDELVERLRRIVSDASARRSMGAAARQRAHEKFGQDRVTSAALTLYRRLLGSAPCGLAAPPAPATGWYRRLGKRAIDVLGSAIGIVLLMPVALALVLAIRLTMGPPVFFRQRRPGLQGRPFELVKFRTMAVRFDAEGRPLPDGERLTKLGRLLRAWSLDELPELWNVLTGDMSLVGPRPLLVHYLDRYTPRQARRHEVRPGITGLAQIAGRNTLAWEEKFELDVQYVDDCSVWLDLKILASTFVQVLGRRGINQPGHATASEFMGTVSR